MLKHGHHGGGSDSYGTETKSNGHGHAIHSHTHSKAPVPTGTARGDAAVQEFVPVPHSSMDALIQLLEARLPKSANVYNCALRLSRNPGEFQMCTLGGDLTVANAWVLTKFPTQVLGAKQMFNVSAPDLSSVADVPPEVRQAFIETPVINWEEHHEFIGLDYAVGCLITEIDTFVKGNLITSHPHFYYTMPREEALKLDVPSILDEKKDVKVQPLDTGRGADFIAATWKYTREGTLDYVRTMIERQPSVGVYVNGVPVSGVITHSEILVGMLGTDPAHRNKGYALVCMKAHLRNLAREGYVPASGVERFNVASQRFHEKVGMRISHKTVDLNNMDF